MSPDRMTETLSALRTDVDRVGLADSASIRHRGQQRTRNQAIGGTLAALCLVAAGVGIAGGLTGDNRAVEGPPAKDGTATTTQQAEQTYAIAADPFLEASDLSGFGVYSDAGFTDAQDEPELMAEQCAVRPMDWPAAEAVGNRYYGELNAFVNEYVLRFDTAADAKAAVPALARQDLTAATCPTPEASQGTFDARTQVKEPALEDAWRFSRYFIPSFASEPSYHEVVTARQGNVVVVLEWMADSNARETGEVLNEWAFTPEFAQTALDRAVAE